MGKMIPLEAARGFAAFAVFINHASHYGLVNFEVAGRQIPNFGQEAVILFFLLSGFVIQYSFSRKRDQSAERFFFDRFTRIYIPLIPTLVLSYFIACVLAGQFLGADLPVLLGNLGMVQDSAGLKPGVIAPTYMDNSPLWSLSYEWWFYGLYFLLFTTIKSIHIRSLIVLGAAIFASFAYLWAPSWLLRIFMYFPMWWIGALAAIYFVDMSRVDVKNLLILSILSLCIIAGLLALGAKDSLGKASFGVHPILELRHMVSAIVMIACILIWRQLKWRGYSIFLRPFALLAPISYGFYICHYPLLKFAPVLDERMGYFSTWIIIIGAILSFSALVEIWLFPKVRNALKTRLFAPIS